MSRTVLIVDDSKTERVVLNGFLKSEYTVWEAASGEEAIALLRQKYAKISAIVMDVVMPGMDGFETLLQIKANAAWLPIPVIITTALDDEGSREKAITCGADNFVTKPFNRALLLHILQNAIRLRETAEIMNALWRDSLTGLLNRESFFTEAERMIKRHEKDYFLLTSFDVENFKVINDQYGTSVGDEVLKHISACLKRFAAENEGLACRYSADKFSLLFPARLRDSDRLQSFYEEMIRPGCINRPIRIRVGSYLIGDRELDISAICDRASMAEQSVKGQFGAYSAEYTEAMRDNLLHEQQIVNDMVGALKSGAFEPWFQPQYNHATGALIGAEALVRWRKDGKIIPPDSFIPVFEKNGFIYEVDQYMWRQVCACLRRWLDEGKAPVPVSVNISRYDLFQQDFLSVLSGLVKEYRLPPDMLRLEITESAFSDSTKELTRAVNKLIAQGFTVEIDDFGSGYSSLNTLKDVPASILKLDMRFFETTKNSQRGGNIVESVVRMAKWLGMAVIAEGVEDQAQADYLKSIGCYYIQGYFYARPMPLDEYEKRMAENEKEPRLSRLHTLATLDNNEFWNPKSMETLIFNSYVGGACIFEYFNEKSELLRVNDQYIRELGGLIPEGAQLKDSTIVRFLSPEDKQVLRDALHEAIERQKEVTREMRLSDGGHVEYARMTARLIARTAERYLFYAVVVNMTEQRSAEQQARNASERITAIMNNSQCGITAVAMHKDGAVEYLFVNRRFFDMLGYTREQFQREVTDPFGCIAPEDYRQTVAAARALRRVGQTAALQMRAVRRDKRVIWLRADISIVRFANIPVPVQLSSFLDVTDQVEAERKRTESVRQLEAIMGNVNGSVSAFLLDDNGNSTLIMGNDKYFELFGYTKEQAEALHLDVMSCILPDDFEMVIAKLCQLKRNGKAVTVDYRAKKRDGSIAYIRSNSSRMSMEGYGDQVIVSVETDITEKLTLEDQFRAVVDNINGGVSATYLQGEKPEYIIVNNRYYDILGYTKEQFEAEVKSIFDLVHPEDRARVEKLFWEASARQKPYTMEYRIIRRNGAVRHILCNTNVIHLFGMEKPVQLSVSNDITVLREAQQKERDLSLQLQAIMANIHGGVTATVYHSRSDVEIAFFNDGFCEMYGYTREQMKAEVPNPLDLIVPEDREKTIAIVERTLRERGSETYEYRCRKRDGSVMWTRVTNSVISLSGVGDTVLLAALSDVSELRRAEQQRLASMDRLQAVMNAMHSGMTAAAFRGEKMELLFANDRFYEMHGTTRAACESKNFKDALALIVPEDRERMRQTILSVAATGKRENAAYRIRRPDGTARWMKAVISETRLTGVDAPVQVTIYTDISAEKEAEEQLRFLNDSARDILAQPYADKAIDGTLRKLLEYFQGDRSYVVEIDEEKRVADNTYEVCAEGVVSENANLQGIPYQPTDFWYSALVKGQFLVIGDVNALGEEEAKLKEMLGQQGIRALIVAPLLRDGQLIGFVGLDNPAHAVDQVKQLTALADYLSVLLTRRDLMRRLERAEARRSAVPAGEPEAAAYGEARRSEERENPLADAALFAPDGQAAADARVSEQYAQLQRLTNSLPGGIATFHCAAGETKLVYFNDGYCSLAGYTRQEFRERHAAFFASVFAEDRHILDEQIARLRKDETPVDCVFRIHTKGGGFKWLSCKGVAVDRVKDALVVNVILADVSRQQEEKERLRVSEEINRLAIELSGNIVTRFDARARTLTLPMTLPPIYALPHVLHDLPEGEISRGRISPDTAPVYRKLFEDILRGQLNGAAVYQQASAKGWRWLKAQYATVLADDGKPVSAVITFTDVTETQEKEAIYSRWRNSLEGRPEHTYALFRANLSKGAPFEWQIGGLMHADGGGARTFDEQTNAFVDRHVYAEDKGRFRAFLCADTLLAGYYRGQRNSTLVFRENCPDGAFRWLKLTVDMVEYPSSKEIEAYLMFEDVDEQKRAELRTIERAETDPLTGVLNRGTFAAKVNHVIGASAPDARHALLMLDMDGFKQVNDTFGHGAGDQALTDVANLLTKASRRGDLVGRLGGDEFLVFLPDIPGEEVAARKARQICDAARRTYSEEVRISASVGIALFPQDGDGFEALYKIADQALYRVKDAGKNSYAFGRDGGGAAEERGAAGAAPAARPRSGIRRMLIVDDNRMDQAYLAGLFREEYRIESAVDGEAALSKLQHYGAAVSVVLLDLMMPGIDGFEVLRRIQENPGTSAIPVIVVSADEKRETALKVLRAGAADLITKPVDPDLLRVRVESAVSKAENERLRAQNSYLAMQSKERDSYRSALERCGILVVTLDWLNGGFTYSPSVSKRLAGCYDGRSFWNILLADLVADSQTVQAMRQLVQELADDRERMEDGMAAWLKTASGQRRLFDVRIFKEVNSFGLADKLILTLREAKPGA